MKSVGICVGSSTITRVDLEKNNHEIKISNVVSKVHEGNIKKTFAALISDQELPKIENIVVTGRKFKNLVKLTSISEPEAIEQAYVYLKEKYPQANYISSAGGETFTTYEMDSSNKIINIFTGNKCASGTGEFFLQQIKRMGINIEAAVTDKNIDQIYKLSGRCSVFCKSDCTHALNKGKDKQEIIVGLCDMMSSKILEHLGENTQQNVWLIGGCSKNHVMVKCLKAQLPKLFIPEEAAYFEALGCALWSLGKETIQPTTINEIFAEEQKSFSILSPLKEAVPLVVFKELKKSTAAPGEQCILGLDVGSTTTKAVLMRNSDQAILASVYLKTLGDPIMASQNCYQAIKNELKCEVKIIGLGVTGSGRQIAGLHALTESIYNEISAHAAAAVFFDPEVDTIFEIGGQDAKYTHILNGVPCDYAMNEACSAGTGSFLEESASEYLNLHFLEIQKIALQSKNPPDFNDQCAAFIGSDIKTAMQENIDVQDIVAGLVYSICKNYLNRVKGSRYVGKKIFMQGGVCYNQAVPIAMASLLKRSIIVPPEPGLMGCFGVAIMVKEKIASGITPAANFDLDTLIARTVNYEKSFVCAGGNIKCDLKCQIKMINIEGTKYPFGGICGKYAGIKTSSSDQTGANLVKLREEMVYQKFAFERSPNKIGGQKVGINRSLLVHSLFPLYYNFLNQLGFEVVLAKKDPNAKSSPVKKDSAFCYPVNLAHEYFKELIKTDVDYIFLPHVKGMNVKNGIKVSLACPLVQGESYYLRTTFKTEKKIIAPVLDFSEGYETIPETFVEIGKEFGIDRERSLAAYEFATKIQNEFTEACQALGKKIIAEIEASGEKAIVLFGRPYNALVRDGNMGIPEKYNSRGYKIIPYDFLPIESETPQQKMYWSMGQSILKAAKYVSRHDQLFGTFVTNFSCGPDSFVVGYFRDIMGEKPSLTLELDSHTADAGIDTRIDAFIDVMKNYKKTNPQGVEEEFKKVVFDYQKRMLRLPDGQLLDLKDKRVKVLVPSMGVISSKIMVAAFNYIGVKAVALDEATDEELQYGRANSSCKECLPLILTVGSLIGYLKKHADPNCYYVYFMPEAPDPCRFGQYHVYTEGLMKKLGITNVALLTLSSGNSYGGMSTKYKLRACQGVAIGDVLEDVKNALSVLAVNQTQAQQIFNEVSQMILRSLASDSWYKVKKVLARATKKLKQISLKGNLKDAKKVLIVGEIYVRRDGFSKQNLIEKLAAKDIIVKIASVSEWLYYCDYLVKKNLSEDHTFSDKITVYLENIVRMNYEKIVKNILAESGLIDHHLIDIEKIIDNAKDLISPHLSGEAILTIGTAITEIIDEVDGIVAIGPFGCMPTRISEAILAGKMSEHKKNISESEIVAEVLKQYPNLPFLSIETDGSAFPQLIDVRLEAFALQVKRINELIHSL